MGHFSSYVSKTCIPPHPNTGITYDKHFIHKIIHTAMAGMSRAGGRRRPPAPRSSARRSARRRQPFASAMTCTSRGGMVRQVRCSPFASQAPSAPRVPPVSPRAHPPARDCAPPHPRCASTASPMGADTRLGHAPASAPRPICQKPCSGGIRSNAANAATSCTAAIVAVEIALRPRARSAWPPAAIPPRAPSSGTTQAARRRAARPPQP